MTRAVVIVGVLMMLAGAVNGRAIGDERRGCDVF